MKMRHSNLYLFIFTVLNLMSCISKDSYKYSEIQLKRIDNFDVGYKEYCNLDFSSNFELNAVQCSFYGDYQNALDQASRRELVSQNPLKNIIFDAGDKANLIKNVESVLQNPQADEASKRSAQKMLNLLTMPDADELFAQAKPVKAVNYIREQAKNYHFTLINEAHFNSQHRSFSQALLKPLWDQGYRYLALETLSYEDTNIHQRGYPVKSSGYYTKDSNFGDLVREALKLGYQLVPYETKNDHDGTLRDRDQAHNIHKQTWKKDKKGKVLIHAGYSHISEMGDTKYEPMGYQLKKLTDQDILTIDQVSMIGFSDTTKQHQYYRKTANKFNFLEPTVFLTKEDSVIIDPVNSLGIDIQVYHPETYFEFGRPDWMKKEDTQLIPLPAKLLKYKGHLIQAVNRGEEIDAVPIDQFVISEGKRLLLKAGNYDLKIINCQGNLIAIVELEINQK